MSFVSNLGACWATLVAQTMKNLLSMQKTQVQSLGQEDSPGEENGYPLL